MNIFKKIREILQSTKLDQSDKICEIEKMVRKKEPVMTEIFGAKVEVRKEVGTMIYDGSVRVDYTDNPRLEKDDDLYYTGCGCTWGTDLDNKRYWMRYSPFITDGGNGTGRFSHLDYGDIINEKARIEKIVMECLRNE